jgi:glycosyltransferase involved in cell wall biosynthesis
MRAVVAHRGARDLYQTARALHEAGRLEALVTDLYWPADRPWAAAIERVLPQKAVRLLRARTETALPGKQTRSCVMSGLCSVAATRFKSTPFDWQRAALRWSDDALGRRAGQIARERGAALLAYSYYGYSAFSECGSAVPKILFQLHPHPVSVRRILRSELERHPDCASNLQREWELALPEEDFARLAAEPIMAGHWIAASSFTKETLVENGIDPKRVHIVPYGVRPERFQSRAGGAEGRLKLLFVGNLTQRKGIRYLLEALRLLDTRQVEATVYGWAGHDMSLFHGFEDAVNLRLSASQAELAQAYASSDLFVFPSLAEGFGHVLLEAMAAGLPVAATNRTAAPDLIEHGDQGFVFQPESATAIAEAVEWALRHRSRLRDMGAAARERARQFTWERFRGGIASVVEYAAV